MSPLAAQDQPLLHMATRKNTRLRFEQWVKNPGCEANVVSAVAGVRMDKVAESLGLTPSFGQSPFAIARGNTFERALLEDGAKSLLGALSKSGALPSGAKGLADYRIRMNGGSLRTLEDALTRTRDLLKEAASQGADGLYGKLPAIIASATMEIPGQPVMLPDGLLVIDALLLRPAEDGERAELAVGEIKTYPYRAGYTDSAELATARGQAGVYLHALELFLGELGISDDLVLSPRGAIVLSLSGQNRPVVLADEDLTFQDKRAVRGFARLREAAAAVTPFDPEDEEKGIAEVLAADTDYGPGCLSFCDMAPRCRLAAFEAGDAVVLGEDVKRLLGDVTIQRAVELLEGAEPDGPREAELAARLTEGLAA